MSSHHRREGWGEAAAGLDGANDELSNWRQFGNDEDDELIWDDDGGKRGGSPRSPQA